MRVRHVFKENRKPLVPMENPCLSPLGYFLGRIEVASDGRCLRRMHNKKQQGKQRCVPLKSGLTLRGSPARLRRVSAQNAQKPLQTCGYSPINSRRKLTKDSSGAYCAHRSVSRTYSRSPTNQVGINQIWRPNSPRVRQSGSIGKAWNERTLHPKKLIYKEYIQNGQRNVALIETGSKAYKRFFVPKKRRNLWEDFEP